jgi:hypothetical protein
MAVEIVTATLALSRRDLIKWSVAESIKRCVPHTPSTPNSPENELGSHFLCTSTYVYNRTSQAIGKFPPDIDYVNAVSARQGWIFVKEVNGWIPTPITVASPESEYHRMVIGPTWFYASPPQDCFRLGSLEPAKTPMLGVVATKPGWCKISKNYPMWIPWSAVSCDQISFLKRRT